MNKQQNIFNLSIEEFEAIINEAIEAKLSQSIKEPLAKSENDAELVTLKQVTQMFQISKQTAYKWLRCNALPPTVKIGGRVYFKKSELEKLINKNI